NRSTPRRRWPHQPAARTLRRITAGGATRGGRPRVIPPAGCRNSPPASLSSPGPGRGSFSAPTDDQRPRIAVRGLELRAKLETALEGGPFERAADHRVRMFLQGLGAVELDVEGRRQEGAADLGPRLVQSHLGDRREDRLEDRIAGLLPRL